ncbi:MAG: type II CRISPR-associated endonuclease Cas1 [Eggerthellaceae bacterium]|jgi:CRISPR-associated protein Cas1
MSFRTVIIENPCRLHYQGGYLVVRKEDETVKIHLSEIASVILQTEQVYISAYLLTELSKQKVSFVVSDEKSNPIGQCLPIYGAHNVSKRIHEQLEWGEPIKKRVWQRVVRDKIGSQAEFLTSREYCEGNILKLMIAEVRSGDTTNREAQAARIYFASLFGTDFNRSYECPLNAALNYGYAILLSMVNREIVSRGYLTQCGICHRSEYNQFNLACDLMEPFRPAVDKLVVDSLASDFDTDVKHTLVDIGNHGMEYKDGSYRLSSVVSLYIQDCLNALNKKIAVEDIAGFRIL